MPAAVMDIEAPSSSEKQVTESVMDEVQSSAPNLLFEGESIFFSGYLFFWSIFRVLQWHDHWKF